MKKEEAVPSDFQENFMFGCHYYRAPTPLPDEWEKDLDNISRADMNMIQLRVQWRWHERRQGSYCWDDTDRLMDLAAKRNISVIFKFMLETAPEWLYKKHDCYRVAPGGTRIEPISLGAYYVGGWLPCFDHPGLRQEGERFIEEAVKRYASHPALYAWHAWNEPRSRPWTECACRESVRSYREWLQRSFVSIEDYNSRLGKAWGSWEELLPPVSTRGCTEMMLWRQWAMWSVADRVKWVHAAIKAADGNHPIIAHVGCCSLVQDVINDTSDDYLSSRTVDWYGSSYPVSRRPQDLFDHALGPMICDWIRSVSSSGHYWINEIYVNPTSWYGQTQPADIEHFLWTPVAHGAKGLMIWQYRSERVGDEVNDTGLVEVDGSITDRYMAAAGVGRSIRKHNEFFLKYIPDPAEAAILYDHRSDMRSRIWKTDPNEPIAFLDNGSTFGMYDYKAALHGSYNLFWANNIPVDWISSRDLGDINRYRLLYLPWPIVMDEEIAARLSEYVKQGGRLISECCPGLFSGEGWVASVPAWKSSAASFGWQEGNRRQLEKKERLMCRWNGRDLPVTRWIAALEKRAIDIGDSLEYNPADLTFPILMPFSAGISFYDSRDKGWLLFAAELFARAGLKEAPVAVDGKMISVRSGSVDGRPVLYICNYERESVEVSLKDAAFDDAQDMLSGLRSGRRFSLKGGQVCFLAK